MATKINIDQAPSCVLTLVPSIHSCGGWGRGHNCTEQNDDYYRDVIYCRLKRKQRKLEKKTPSKEGASKEEGGAKVDVGGAKAEEGEEEEIVSSGGEEEPHFVIGGR